MKDPLDQRDDPYEQFNEEARRQGKPAQVSMETKPMAIRTLFGSLRARTENPEQLLMARDKLTRVEMRMVVDIFFYCLEDTVAFETPLSEPQWPWEQIPLPELTFDSSFLQIVTGDEEMLIPPLEFRPLTLNPLMRYDEVMMPSLEVAFDK